MVARTLFSSLSAEWCTPPDLFEDLNWFYNFNADLAASHQNHLLKNYYYNGLVIENDRARYKKRQRSLFDEIDFWRMRGFLNPVYGQAEQPCKPKCNKDKCRKRGWHTDVYLPGIEDFIKHVHELVQINEYSFVVLILPARTCTTWWHKYIAPCRLYGGVEEIPGRLRFWVDGKPAAPAPFPSVKVLFK